MHGFNMTQKRLTAAQVLHFELNLHDIKSTCHRIAINWYDQVSGLMWLLRGNLNLRATFIRGLTANEWS